MAESLLVGAAVGAVFGELLKAVLEMKDKALMFKPTLEYLATTLDLITPVIKEIEHQNDELGRPKEELEYLTRKMEEGTKVVYKCLKISKLNLLARIRHQDQLAELVESFMRFFIINMQAQISRDMKETLLKVRRINSTLHKRSRSFLRTGSSSDSASEDVGLSQIEIHDSTAVQPTDENSMETNSNGEEAIIDHPARLLPSGSGVVPVCASELEHLESKSTHPTLDAAWTDSAEQEMEIITSLSQKFSQIEAKAENNKATNNSMSNKPYDQLYTNKRTFLGIRLPKIKPVQRMKDGLKGQDTKDPFEPRKMTAFEGYLSNSDLEELLSAPAELLGKTKYGASYKVSLKDGTAIVVKRLKNVSVGKEQFERLMETAQKLSQHPNVMPLRAWYYSSDEILLICDYMAAGNLSKLLHGTRRASLDWNSRMKILLGVAKGVAHIHFASGEEFVHGNISSSNVLVTVDFQGRISDLVITSSVSASFDPFGKIGYHPPVVMMETENLTQKSDVYSFGILLFEMLTGKLPLEPYDLPDWVQTQAMDGLLYSVFDYAIQDNKYASWQILQLANACVAKKPDLRPSMNEVVMKMEEIIASGSN